MRWGILWWLLPDEALPLLFLAALLAFMVGLLSGRAILGLLGLIALFPLLGAVIEAVLGELPPWVSLLVLAFVALALLQGVAALFLGSHAAATMTGHLAADFVRLGLRLAFVPFRVVGWAARAALGGWLVNARGGDR